jgi:hypothetical protein
LLRLGLVADLRTMEMRKLLITLNLLRPTYVDLGHKRLNKQGNWLVK